MPTPMGKKSKVSNSDVSNDSGTLTMNTIYRKEFLILILNIVF